MSASKHSHYKKWIAILLPMALLTMAIETCSLSELLEEVKWIMDRIAERAKSRVAPSIIDPTPMISGLPTETGLGGNTAGTLKPVGFTNIGTIPATIMAWTYTPLNSETPTTPSNASTVASPGGNSSSYLSLPLGTYTWCYYWEIGDINKDGMMEYAHALDERPVILDESDSDDLAFAESVTLAAPADFGAVAGVCGMDISQFIVARQHADNINGALVNMGHDGDSVTLKGPITIIYWYIYNTQQEIFADTPREYSTPEMVVIPAGEIWTFTLVDGHDEHPGDWNVYIWLVSINE